ncbi:MAG: hypothetical protein HKN32_03980, partial [Flavobacteriales bacterium]|nr:hypothetical protein [Flavobacteriales bacterium]
MKRVAIIDCGTNTFNLLVADVSEEGDTTVIFKNKVPVKLAPSTTTNLIGKNRFARGVDALHVHLNNVTNMGVEIVRVFATSAIRKSDNGQEFVDFVKANLGLQIETISGDEEADLIFKGVQASVSHLTEPFAIMDIGGGSVEFIIGSGTKKLWQKSVDVGVSRLKGQFPPEDPMAEGTVLELKKYIDVELLEVYNKLKEHHVAHLIGASGSFDTIQQIVAPQSSAADGAVDTQQQPKCQEISRPAFEELRDRLLSSTLAQRVEIRGMLPMRADMINYAMVLFDCVLLQ